MKFILNLASFYSCLKFCEMDYSYRYEDYEYGEGQPDIMTHYLPIGVMQDIDGVEVTQTTSLGTILGMRRVEKDMGKWVKNIWTKVILIRINIHP